MRIKGLLIAFAAIVAMSSAAMPAPQQGVSMTVGNVTSQPIGHYDFCQRHTDECGPTRNIGPVDMNAAAWALVNQINLRVNKTIRPATDMEVYGQEEYWEYPKTAGDCEDFALLKRKLLIQSGISASNLLMTVVRKPDGEGHAVLTLRTKQGDFILDNLEDEIKVWTKTPYSYLKRQASFNAGRWVTIENGNDVLVGAVK
ncbi:MULTISPECIES: transglutaminase-like cysteine peptidase [unclassified Rhizobium]|uniref:transglutaminase-like cysteine peptidase n=1 Tax=unclassified Rhizobium TaxID=2613769 RepID=UPI00084BFD76|nr:MULTISPECIES: transglutaminase-like cysteine peptidase [unclassified Rhizobium]OED00107.1 transglutaminase [Rhizobium sp. YK2]QYA13282.1 transglutaminase-like cysteine peptidase [Rhizobium sp. AB2/73]UEQ80785.1 transglutaminase-like cysteine peptidase [Rhizobium sp. AB2/73]